MSENNCSIRGFIEAPFGGLTLLSDIRITGRYELTLFDLTGCYILPNIKSVCAKRERKMGNESEGGRARELPIDSLDV